MSIPILNYIGSKFSLLPYIKYVVNTHFYGGIDVGIEDNADLHFADLFSGTGVVSSMFNQDGWRVSASDIQYYAYVLAYARLLSSDSESRRSLVEQMKTASPVSGFITQTYSPQHISRKYFTIENAMRIDGMIQFLASKRATTTLSDYYYAVSCLLATSDRVGNVASVYGAYLKQFKKTALRPITIEPLPIAGKNCEFNTVQHCSAEEAIGRFKDVDVAYLDPPYNARQYCTNYHVLETIARGDTPVTHGVTGLREYAHQKSAFCSKSTVSEAFRNIIERVDAKHVVVSYSSNGLITSQDIAQIMISARYTDVVIYSIPYHKFKTGKKAVTAKQAPLRNI